MAEPFSIATGALQVAGAGVQLAKTLYDVARDVRDAEKDIKQIAREVDLTAKVLENLAAVLNDDATSQVCSPNLRKDAQAALDGCKEAFVQLETALRAMHRPVRKPMSKIPIITRVKWPLTKPRMAEMRTNLERLKTLLSLMLEVVNLASKQSSSPLQQSNDRIDEDRRRIDRLIKSNEELYTSLSTNFAAVGIQSLIPMPAPDGKAIEPAQITPSELGRELPAKPYWTPANGALEDDILKSFDGCRRAIENLMSTIDSALTSWKVSQRYEIEALDREVNAVRELVADLPRHTCSRPGCTATFPSVSAALQHEQNCSPVMSDLGFLLPSQYFASRDTYYGNDIDSGAADLLEILCSAQSLPLHASSAVEGNSGMHRSDGALSAAEPASSGTWAVPTALKREREDHAQQLTADPISPPWEIQTPGAAMAEAATQILTANYDSKSGQGQAPQETMPEVVPQSDRACRDTTSSQPQRRHACVEELANDISPSRPSRPTAIRYPSRSPRRPSVQFNKSQPAESSQRTKETLSDDSFQSGPIVREATFSSRITSTPPALDSDQDESSEPHGGAAAARTKSVALGQVAAVGALTGFQRKSERLMETVDSSGPETRPSWESSATSGAPVFTQDEGGTNSADRGRIAHSRTSSGSGRSTSQSEGFEYLELPDGNCIDDRISKHEAQETDQSFTDALVRKRKLSVSRLQKRSVRRMGRGRSSTDKHTQEARRRERADDAVDMLLQRWTVARAM